MNNSTHCEITRNTPALNVRINHATGTLCNARRIRSQLACAGRALSKLNNLGFTVERIALDGYTRPAIRVQFDGHCRRKQERGEAVRYVRGFDERGKYEKYQMQPDNCRISWLVR